ncbi:chemotaxis protein CheW [Spongisporangium articulatum]|uniref:Chemotaxis protein CheW n=1 Tax=Spongisporangium articulatum TaxID=3362603 RepID=A0ABW8AKP7_9ACTN
MSQLSTFVVGPYLFGVEVELVQEIVRLESMTPVPLAAGAIGGLINLRGEVITAVDLRKRLGMPPAKRVRPGTLNVVVRVDGEPTSLVVDEIGGVVTVDGLPFEETPSTVDAQVRDLIGGAFTLPERLLLALNVRSVLTGLEAPALAG